LTDEELLAEFHELVKEFGSGEGSWVDGTPEGNALWALSHGSPVVLQASFADQDKLPVVFSPSQGHWQVTATDVTYVLLDEVGSKNAGHFSTTALGELVGSAGSARLVVWAAQSGNLNLVTAADSAPSQRRPLVAVSL